MLITHKLRYVKQPRLLGSVFRTLWAQTMGATSCEIEKIEALARVKGNYEGYMSISDRAKEEISWWLRNMNSSFRNN